jgi:hypothetical protein
MLVKVLEVLAMVVAAPILAIALIVAVNVVGEYFYQRRFRK